jgi:hypothetical protein
MDGITMEMRMPRLSMYAELLAIAEDTAIGERKLTKEKKRPRA